MKDVKVTHLCLLFQTNSSSSCVPTRTSLRSCSCSVFPTHRLFISFVSDAGTQPPAEEGPADREVAQVNIGTEEEEDNQRRHKRAKHVERDGEAPALHPLAVALTLYDPSMAAPVPVSLGGPGGLRSPLMVLRFELGLQNQKVLVSVTGGSCSAKLPRPAASESLGSAVELVSEEQRV